MEALDGGCKDEEDQKIMVNNAAFVIK